MPRLLDSDGSLAKKAVALIELEKPRIARAVARQMQLTVPKYRDIDTTALAKGNETTLDCIGDLLLKRKLDGLVSLTENLAEMRSAAGFSVADFTVAGLCFLPVLRRYLVVKGDSIEHGLRMYEVVEALTLPFTGKVATIFLECMDESTRPDGVDRGRLLKLLSDSMERHGLAGLRPAPIASLDDEEALDFEDDGEPTAPGFANDKRRGSAPSGG